jgi:hypothetical protein
MGRELGSLQYSSMYGTISSYFSAIWIGPPRVEIASWDISWLCSSLACAEHTFGRQLLVSHILDNTVSAQYTNK